MLSSPSRQMGEEVPNPADNLTPLSKSLIPPELASAFKITPETPRTAMDVRRASQSTISSLGSYPFVTNPDDLDGPDPVPVSKKSRRNDEDKNHTADEDQSTANKTALKRPRLVWTSELHNRFVQVVARLGLNKAVPKTIMQLMNVDGLTRENVASHLQKYRLYIKRQGLPNDGSLPNLDHHQLFAQQSFAESSNANRIMNHNSGGTGTSETKHQNHSYSYGQMMMPIAMPHYHHHLPQMMQMPMTSSSGHGFHSYHNQQHHKYNGMVQQQRDWSENDNKWNGY